MSRLQPEFVINSNNLNTSTLDLFRQEVEDKLLQIDTCLYRLSHGTRQVKPLVACMHAAGSIKDAANMAGMPAVVSLAQGLESCIRITQQTRHSAPLSTFDLFQRCSNLLGRMTRAEPAESAAGTDLHTETQQLLASLRKREQAALAPRVSDTQEIAAMQLPASAESAPAPQPQPPPPPPPVVPPPVNEAVTPPPARLPFDDVPLLELFRQEAEELSKTIFNGLRALRYDVYSVRQIEACIRASHSFMGAARIAGLPGAVDLSRALEACFTAAYDRKITLNRKSVELLSAGLDLLMRVTRAPEQARQGSKHPDMDAFLAALKGLSRGTEPIVIPPLSAQP